MSEKSDFVKALPDTLKAIKEFSKYLVIPSGLFVFTPTRIIDYINLIDIRNDIGKWISGVFILSLSICIFDAAKYLFSILSLRNLRRKLFSNLTAADLQCLAEVAKEGSRSYCPPDTTVYKLIKQGVLSLDAHGIAAMAPYYSVSLPIWVKKKMDRTKKAGDNPCPTK